MKLLSRAEVIDKKAQEVAREVQRGVAIAGEVDRVRTNLNTAKNKFEAEQNRQIELHAAAVRLRADEIRELDNQITRRRQERADLMKPLDALEHDIQVRSARVEERESNLKSWSDRLATMEKQAAADRSALFNLKAELSDWQQALVEREVGIARRERFIKDLTTMQEQGQRTLQQAGVAATKRYQTWEQTLKNKEHELNTREAAVEGERKVVMSAQRRLASSRSAFKAAVKEYEGKVNLKL